MPPPGRKKLGDILLEMGAVDELQLKSALGYHQQWGVPLGRALVERRMCSTELVLQALSVQTGLPVVELDRQPLPQELAALLPEKVAHRLRVVPLEVKGARGEVLVVAAAAPVGLDSLDAVRSATGKQRVEPMLASDDAIERAIGRLYRGELPPEPEPERPDVPVSHVPIENEQMFELEGNEGAAAPSPLPLPPAARAPTPVPQPPAARVPTPAPVAAAAPRQVLLFGWSESVGQALCAALQRAGVAARVATDEETLGCGPRDIVITATLSLETFLGPGERLPGQVVVCGLPEAADMREARALGARLYLQPPFSVEQLVGAIGRLQ